MADFFRSGFDGRYGFPGAMPAAGMMGTSVSGYYHQMSPHASSMTSQYMQAGMGGMYMGSAMQNGGLNLPSHLASNPGGVFSIPPSSGMPNSIVAGATA